MLLVGLSALFGVAAPATASDLSSSIISSRTAPLALTRCSVDSQYINGYHTSVNVYNRSTRGMIDFTIEYRFYDRENVQIGSTIHGSRSYFSPNGVTEPGDTATVPIGIGVDLAEPPEAVSRVTCRLYSAAFTGRSSWRYGQVWHGGPLSNPPSATTSQSSQHNVPGRSAIAGPKSWTFDVAEGWNDKTQVGLFVHDTIVIHGGDADATVRPENFHLRMDLSNGSKKSYSALNQQAPQYTKYGALAGGNTLAFQVDPQQDLGKLGTLIVPAHGTVRVTLTFFVNDSVENASANREITLI